MVDCHQIAVASIVHCGGCIELLWLSLVFLALCAALLQRDRYAFQLEVWHACGRKGACLGEPVCSIRHQDVVLTSISVLGPALIPCAELCTTHAKQAHRPAMVALCAVSKQSMYTSAVCVHMPLYYLCSGMLESIYEALLWCSVLWSECNLTKHYMLCWPFVLSSNPGA